MRRLSIAFILACFLLPVSLAWPQAATPAATPAEDASAEPALPPIPFYHTVVAGESLFSIGQLYETSAEAIVAANGLTDADFLFVGQTLRIPGVPGFAAATRHQVAFGETIWDIAAAYNTHPERILAQNDLINPAHLAPGRVLSVTSRTGTTAPLVVTGRPYFTRSGDTLWTIAARHALSPTRVAQLNRLAPFAPLSAERRLRLPGDAPYRYLPDRWTALTLAPVPAAQGETVSLRVAGVDLVRATATVIAPDGAPAPFSLTRVDDGFLGFIGLDAFTQAGTYRLTVEGEGPRPYLPLEFDLPVTEAGYGLQQIVVPEAIASLLAPEVRAQDDALLAPIYATVSAEKRWDGVFTQPVSNTIISAAYGDARSYNGGPYDIFHTGIDFVAASGTPVLAAAPGEVVFSGVTTLRGEMIIIDHGLGVMTSYGHLSERIVESGAAVAAGQPIGALGNTGLSTGAHLHWEVRIRGVPVDAARWLSRAYP